MTWSIKYEKRQNTTLQPSLTFNHKLLHTNDHIPLSDWILTPKGALPDLVASTLNAKGVPARHFLGSRPAPYALTEEASTVLSTGTWNIHSSTYPYRYRNMKTQWSFEMSGTIHPRRQQHHLAQLNPTMRNWHNLSYIWTQLSFHLTTYYKHSSRSDIYICKCQLTTSYNILYLMFRWPCIVINSYNKTN